MNPYFWAYRRTDSSLIDRMIFTAVLTNRGKVRAVLLDGSHSELPPRASLTGPHT